MINRVWYDISYHTTHAKSFQIILVSFELPIKYIDESTLCNFFFSDLVLFIYKIETMEKMGRSWNYVVDGPNWNPNFACFTIVSSYIHHNYKISDKCVLISFITSYTPSPRWFSLDMSRLLRKGKTIIHMVILLFYF